MNIIPDPTLTAIQAIPFAITLGALHFILFKPMLAYLGEREEAIDGARAAAEALEAKAAAKLDEYEAEVKTARTAAAAHRAELYQTAKTDQASLVAEARAEADTKIDAALSEIGAAKEAASVQLSATATALADDVVSQLLNRPAS